MENRAKRKQASSTKSRSAPKRPKVEASGGSAQVAQKRSNFILSDEEEEHQHYEPPTVKHSTSAVTQAPSSFAKQTTVQEPPPSVLSQKLPPSAVDNSHALPGTIRKPALTVQQKVEILDRAKEIGDSSTGLEFNVAKSTIRFWRKNEDQLRDHANLSLSTTVLSATSTSRPPHPPVTGTAGFDEPLALLHAVNDRASASIARINPPSKRQFDASSHKRVRPASPEREPLASTSSAPLRRSTRGTTTRTKHAIAELLNAAGSHAEDEGTDDDDSEFDVQEASVSEDDDDVDNEELLEEEIERSKNSVKDHPGSTANDNGITEEDFYYGHHDLTPELLSMKKPVHHLHYRYYYQKQHAHTMQWRCTNYGTKVRKANTCKVAFTCDHNGENIVWSNPVHTHEPRLKVGRKAQRCPHCYYAWKSNDDRRAHQRLTGHDENFQYECDFPGCGYKCLYPGAALSHAKKHYGANTGQKGHIDQYDGPGINIPLLGLNDGDKCPDCNVRIVCLSHYAWHMEQVHGVRGKSIATTRHLRCVACSMCIVSDQARNHFLLYCPFTGFPELSRELSSSDGDRKLAICDCKAAPLSPHDYPNPLKTWIANTLNATNPSKGRHLSSTARKFFARQSTEGSGNNVYVIVQVDPTKSYTVAEFAACVRYVGSCQDTKRRYIGNCYKHIPTPPASSSERLYIVRLCAVVGGTTVRFFNDGDALLLENFVILHFGLRNLYNIVYPIATRATMTNPDFHEFITASAEIVQALMEGTYETIVKPRNWKEPHVSVYEAMVIRGQQNDAAKQQSSGQTAGSAQTASLTITTSAAFVQAPSSRAVGNTQGSETSSSEEPGPVNSQEYATRFYEVAKQYSSAKKIPVAHAVGRLLRKHNITPLFIDNASPDGPHSPSVRQSSMGTESVTGFGPDASALADETSAPGEGQQEEEQAKLQKEQEQAMLSLERDQKGGLPTKMQKPNADNTSATSSPDGPQSAQSDDSGADLRFEFTSTTSNDATAAVRPSADTNDAAADLLGLDAAQLSTLSPEVISLWDNVPKARSLPSDSSSSSDSEDEAPRHKVRRLGRSNNTSEAASKTLTAKVNDSTTYNAITTKPNLEQVQRAVAGNRETFTGAASSSSTTDRVKPFEPPSLSSDEDDL